MASAESLKTTMYLEAVVELPDGVRENVLALQSIQAKYQELFLKMCQEKSKITEKFDAQLDPLYEKRAEIVMGTREPTEEEIKKGADVAEEPEESKVEVLDDDEEVEKPEAAEVQEDAEKGIPQFWLTAMQNEAELGQLIEEQDEEILAHLVNITKHKLSEEEGFELRFTFEKNAFFSEETLTKKYITQLDEDDGEIMIQKAEGCKISWNEGQNPTVKTKKKRQQSKTGKGHRVVNKVVSVDSFFKFFTPPYAADEDMTEEMAEKMQADYSAGCCFTDRLIPRGVAWFTGEAAASYLGLNYDDFAGDDDDDDEDGEGAAPGGDQKECKTQ